jgi:5'-methylthioadenosine phosphorylase
MPVAAPAGAGAAREAPDAEDTSMDTVGALGVIGGSGLYAMEGLEVEQEVEVETPFGFPSDRFTLGRLDGRRVVFLPRHGRGHRLLPHEVPYRANIFALKQLGVRRILSVAACGSMKEHIHPCHAVVPDQFIDRTRRREDTFFGHGIVAHVSFADPICPQLHAVVCEAAGAAGATVWKEGTYLCIEGPAFSSRAESLLYRSWGVSVIGMTNATEAKLAREAELCYATLAMPVDYDCWRLGAEPVSVEMLVENLARGTALSQQVVREVAARLPEQVECECDKALASALYTRPEHMPRDRVKTLDIILQKYVN